ncbi:MULTISPECIES: competence type IV pilus minor pilin ComGD [Alteribacter]|uniref:Prepilin-type N-terminal cleavage/methylation domain-containing protein n=1 Tax=Alteribacter keqinensis TaxID=2483800 RepID=A0A3M7TTJ1_9BACI|nr:MULTISPECIES: competence type IV pilus minor pilin ComGD [Alteribacter]MBM7097318.1 prepilin-type N-terminal cleavage/methylation domain-containing protein [Alteribacter salitolerans]RNA68948.1 prepilin-type N-terminal cleavage/methylation domain-containing protein [Alteribacter keqinensis]
MAGNRGHTLIELAVVLSILSSLLLITLPLFKQPETGEADLFFELLEKDFYFAQMKAVNEGRTVHFVFDSVDNKYVIMQGRSELQVRYFPEKLSVAGTSMGLSNPQFLQNGNVSRSGTLTFNYNNKNLYRIVFVFIRGRFYIEKV